MSAEPRFLNDRLLRDATSWRCGGPCSLYCEPRSLDELRTALEIARERGQAVKVIGSGTNVLVSDAGVDALVLRLTGDFAKVEFSGTTVKAGAGAGFDHLVSICCKHGLAGLEQCSGIPGTVGGAVVGNAGVKGCWAGDRVRNVTVCTASGELEILTGEECGFGYRQSSIEGVLLSCEFDLEHAESQDLLEVADKARERRKEIPCTKTAGSVFKNPPSEPAGRLLDQVGMKGVREGGAYYSTAHANFIVNDGGTARDIRNLMLAGQNAVREKFKVELEPEVRLWGFDEEGGKL